MGNVTFLGVEGSGKSVLTMAIVNAFKTHEVNGYYLRPDTRESFRFIEQTPDFLFGGDFPHQTTSLKYLRWTIQYRGQDIRTFDTLDYPGEIYRLAFLDAKDSSDPNDFTARVATHQSEIDELLKHLVDSDQVFVLFNPSDSDDISRNNANLDAVWITNACLDYLHRLPQKPEITLLLTQVDRYCDIETQDFDPEIFVKHHLPLICHNFPDLNVLAVSAIGSAQSSLGIDDILFLCLKDAEVLSPAIKQLQETYNNVVQCFDAPGTFIDWPVNDMKISLEQSNYIYNNALWFYPQRFSAVLASKYPSPSKATSELLGIFKLVAKFKNLSTGTDGASEITNLCDLKDSLVKLAVSTPLAIHAKNILLTQIPTILSSGNVSIINQLKGTYAFIQNAWDGFSLSQLKSFPIDTIVSSLAKNVADGLLLSRVITNSQILDFTFTAPESVELRAILQLLAKYRRKEESEEEMLKTALEIEQSLTTLHPVTDRVIRMLNSLRQKVSIFVNVEEKKYNQCLESNYRFIQTCWGQPSSLLNVPVDKVMTALSEIQRIDQVDSANNAKFVLTDTDLNELTHILSLVKQLREQFRNTDSKVKAFANFRSELDKLHPVAEIAMHVRKDLLKQVEIAMAQEVNRTQKAVLVRNFIVILIRLLALVIISMLTIFVSRLI